VTSAKAAKPPSIDSHVAGSGTKADGVTTWGPTASGLNALCTAHGMGCTGGARAKVTAAGKGGTSVTTAALSATLPAKLPAMGEGTIENSVGIPKATIDGDTDGP
jgi:hypothetical protein